MLIAKISNSFKKAEDAVATFIHHVGDRLEDDDRKLKERLAADARRVHHRLVEDERAFRARIRPALDKTMKDWLAAKKAFQRTALHLAFFYSAMYILNVALHLTSAVLADGFYTPAGWNIKTGVFYLSIAGSISSYLLSAIDSALKIDKHDDDDKKLFATRQQGIHKFGDGIKRAWDVLVAAATHVAGSSTVISALQAGNGEFLTVLSIVSTVANLILLFYHIFHEFGHFKTVEASFDHSLQQQLEKTTEEQKLLAAKTQAEAGGASPQEAPAETSADGPRVSGPPATVSATAVPPEPHPASPPPSSTLCLAEQPQDSTVVAVGDSRPEYKPL